MMRRDVAGGLVAIVVAIALASPIGAGRDEPFVEGERLSFAFLDLDGRIVRSSDPEFRGKVLLIDLWGTWCPPCISEIPTFKDLQARLGDRGLVIVAVAFESEDEDAERRRARLRRFVADQEINYVVLDGREPRDADEAFPGLRNVRGFPVEILIARDGRVVDVRNGYGYKRRWAGKLEKELTELLDAGAPRMNGSERE